MAHEGGKGVECSSSSAAFRDLLPLKRCRFIGGLSVNEVLPDDILVQILCRLPRQSAMASKLVCKRWFTLISTPNFISCFIKEHYRAHQQEKYRILKADSKYLFLTSQTPNSDISFSFLPSTESSSSNSGKSKVTILASSDDLFLCLSFLSTTAYFICNPFTKEWFDLPPPPPTSCHRGHAIIFGFTHKPYYHVEQGSEQHVLVNSRCRFSVVRLNSPLKEASNFEIDTFSSETWEWTTSMLQHSSSPSRPSSSISRNGLLYWLCNITGRVIIHDPYNHKVCYVVEESPGFPEWYGFSVSQGSLFLFDIYPSFRVWELEDEDRQPKWRFVIPSLDKEENMEKSSEMLEWISAPIAPFAVIAIHPNDRNMFYLSGSGGVGTLNLRTGQFKRRFVPKLVSKVVPIYHELGARKTIKINPSVMVVFKAPCWPTPISALLNQAC